MTDSMRNHEITALVRTVASTITASAEDTRPEVVAEVYEPRVDGPLEDILDEIGPVGFLDCSSLIEVLLDAILPNSVHPLCDVVLVHLHRFCLAAESKVPASYKPNELAKDKRSFETLDKRRFNTIIRIAQGLAQCLTHRNTFHISLSSLYAIRKWLPSKNKELSTLFARALKFWAPKADYKKEVCRVEFFEPPRNNFSNGSQTFESANGGAIVNLNNRCTCPFEPKSNKYQPFFPVATKNQKERPETKILPKSCGCLGQKCKQSSLPYEMLINFAVNLAAHHSVQLVENPRLLLLCPTLLVEAAVKYECKLKDGRWPVTEFVLYGCNEYEYKQDCSDSEKCEETIRKPKIDQSQLDEVEVNSQDKECEETSAEKNVEVEDEEEDFFLELDLEKDSPNSNSSNDNKTGFYRYQALILQSVLEELARNAIECENVPENVLKWLLRLGQSQPKDEVANLVYQLIGLYAANPKSGICPVAFYIELFESIVDVPKASQYLKSCWQACPDVLLVIYCAFKALCSPASSIRELAAAKICEWAQCEAEVTWLAGALNFDMPPNIAATMKFADDPKKQEENLEELEFVKRLLEDPETFRDLGKLRTIASITQQKDTKASVIIPKFYDFMSAWRAASNPDCAGCLLRIIKAGYMAMRASVENSGDLETTVQKKVAKQKHVELLSYPAPPLLSETDLLHLLELMLGSGRNNRMFLYAVGRILEVPWYKESMLLSPKEPCKKGCLTPLNALIARHEDLIELQKTRLVLPLFKPEKLRSHQDFYAALQTFRLLTVIPATGSVVLNHDSPFLRYLTKVAFNPDDMEIQSLIFKILSKLEQGIDAMLRSKPDSKVGLVEHIGIRKIALESIDKVHLHSLVSQGYFEKDFTLVDAILRYMERQTFSESMPRFLEAALQSTTYAPDAIRCIVNKPEFQCPLVVKACAEILAGNFGACPGRRRGSSHKRIVACAVAALLQQNVVYPDLLVQAVQNPNMNSQASVTKFIYTVLERHPQYVWRIAAHFAQCAFYQAEGVPMANWFWRDLERTGFLCELTDTCIKSVPQELSALALLTNFFVEYESCPPMLVELNEQVISGIRAHLLRFKVNGDYNSILNRAKLELILDFMVTVETKVPGVFSKLSEHGLVIQYLFESASELKDKEFSRKCVSLLYLLAQDRVNYAYLTAEAMPNQGIQYQDRIVDTVFEYFNDNVVHGIASLFCVTVPSVELMNTLVILFNIRKTEVVAFDMVKLRTTIWLRFLHELMYSSDRYNGRFAAPLGKIFSDEDVQTWATVFLFYILDAIPEIPKVYEVKEHIERNRLLHEICEYIVSYRFVRGIQQNRPHGALERKLELAILSRLRWYVSEVSAVIAIDAIIAQAPLLFGAPWDPSTLSLLGALNQRAKGKATQMRAALWRISSTTLANANHSLAPQAAHAVRLIHNAQVLCSMPGFVSTNAEAISLLIGPSMGRPHTLLGDMFSVLLSLCTTVNVQHSQKFMQTMYELASAIEDLAKYRGLRTYVTSKGMLRSLATYVDLQQRQHALHGTTVRATLTCLGVLLKYTYYSDVQSRLGPYIIPVMLELLRAEAYMISAICVLRNLAFDKTNRARITRDIPVGVFLEILSKSTPESYQRSSCAVTYALLLLVWVLAPGNHKLALHAPALVAKIGELVSRHHILYKCNRTFENNKVVEKKENDEEEEEEDIAGVVAVREKIIVLTDDKIENAQPEDVSKLAAVVWTLLRPRNTFEFERPLKPLI